jgi:hypothetical protein
MASAEAAHESTYFDKSRARVFGGATPPRYSFELLALAAVALAVGFVIQLCVFGAGVLLARPTTPRRVADVLQRYATGLLSPDHTVVDYLGLVLHNVLALAAFTVAALLLAGVRVSRFTVRRRVGLAVAVALASVVFLEIARQNAELLVLFGAWGKNPVGTPRIMLVLCLPHGPLEFGALALPLLAATRSTLRSGRGVLAAAALGVPLLFAAAAVETWVSPVLLQLVTTGMRPS